MNEIENIRQIDKEIKKNIEKALSKSQREDNVIVIAVSKTHPVEIIQQAIAAGIINFGENYVQELIEKYDYFEKNNLKQPEWHYIGHLQSNKVKQIVGKVKLIHSVDSLKLAEEVNKRSENINIIQKILLQINTSDEESKSGCDKNDAVEIVEKILKLKNIEIQGLMTIGTFTDDETIQRKEFSILRNTLNEINKKLNINLKSLSMGMSSDYIIAIEEGATYIRIGTTYFGSRNYNI